MAQLRDFIVGAQSVKFCHTNHECSTHKHTKEEEKRMHVLEYYEKKRSVLK